MGLSGHLALHVVSLSAAVTAVLSDCGNLFDVCPLMPTKPLQPTSTGRTFMLQPPFYLHRPHQWQKFRCGLQEQAGSSLLAQSVKVHLILFSLFSHVCAIFFCLVSSRE